MKDLQKLLRTWTPSPPPHSEFQLEVWSRIASLNTPPPATGTLFSRCDALLTSLLRPQVVLASVAAAVILGAVVGGLFSVRNDSERENYLASVNPYVMARSAP